MLNFAVDLHQTAGPSLSQVLAQMRDLSGINKAMAAEADSATVAYLRSIAAYRHTSASRLGAAPTGALERAAGRVTHSATSTEAVVTVVGPMFGRVTKDVTITPKKSGALTIPIHALSYGRRVAELEAQGYKFFKPGGKGSARRMLWARDPGGAKFPMYVLASSVHQAQDRTLLPSDDAYLDAARRGARSYLTAVLHS